MPRRLPLALALCALWLAGPQTSAARADDDWIATWTASPQEVWAPDFLIRESRAFDGVVDFDALLRDPARPSFLKAAYDSGDHLHPNDAGYQAMATAIDLKLLTPRR